jgi:2-polyprenyl-6-methoxyphenol hydroxylase-like FAD-dependent oxidoreductase
MNILIVGGGIAGLSAAIALQGDGHDITIAETLDGWKRMLPTNPVPFHDWIISIIVTGNCLHLKPNSSAGRHFRP